MKKVLKWIILSFPLGIILFLGILLLTASEVKKSPTFEQVKDSYKKSDALLLDRHGQVIHEMRIDKKGRRLDWVELRDISPAFLKSVLLVEDRRFYQHHGVDWYGIAFSFLQNPLSPKRRGASTITMQLTSLLDKRLKPKGVRRTLKQKWNQICSARQLEKIWSKQQILEAYLNLISYRDELQGISAASRGLLAKEPSGLDVAESLILASLITSPNAPIDRLIQRACFFGRSLGGQTMDESIKALAEERLRSPYRIKPTVSLASQVAHKLLKGGATKVVSTLDGKLQRFAYEILNHYLESLKEGHVSDGAVLVIDNKTGEILAYVGNSGPTASAALIDGISTRRQAGSTLKPFLYELAIEKGLLTSASLLEDSPLQVSTPTGLYIPQNYDNHFRGPVSLRTALSGSINIPAVKVLLLVGLNPFVDRLKQLGFESLMEEPEYYGYSLALGSADVTLLELANAYRTLANTGRWSQLKLSFDQKVEKPVQILDKNSAFIISTILSDREARSTTFGLENPLSTKFWTAAKTGTSKDMRDNWCLGYSEKYTVGVWVGNFSGEPMRNVSGVSGAAPIWLEIMNYLHANRPSKPPQLPAGVIPAQASFHQDLETPRREYFIRGTEPVADLRLNTLDRKPHILYPLNEMLINIDPEIPDDLQLVPFQFQPPVNQYEWVLNDQKTGIMNSFFLWKPKQGNYVLSIVDQKNYVIDSITFIVK